MKSKKAQIVIIFVLTCSIIFAVNKDAGTTGFQFMNMSYSARALGLSNAYTALSDDADAVYFNPAGITQPENKQIKSNYINYLDGMNGGSVSIVIPQEEFVNLAFFAKYLNSGDITKTEVLSKEAYVETGNFSASNFIVGACFAKKINPNLDLGLTFKYNLEQLDDASASAIAFDVGILHQTNNPKLMIGAVIKNLGKQLSYFSEVKYDEGLPTEATLGARYTFNDKIKALLDLNQPFDNDLFANIGVEYNVIQTLCLRAGFDTRSANYRAGGDNEIFSGISAGFGIKYKNYGVDYGVSSKGDLGWNNQLSLNIRL